MRESKVRIIEDIIDAVDEGIILLNKHNVIKLMNNNAKEYLGVELNQTRSHGDGQLMSGDIVIIVNNKLGEDDGNLQTRDLEILNIVNSDIKQGDAIIVIGIYDNAAIKPIYKYWRETSAPLKYCIDTEFYGFRINAQINTNEQKHKITINDVVYTLSYMHSIGNIVIIDGKGGNVKFFQERGYTIRKESIKDILLGCKYQNKSPQKKFDVIGKNINELIVDSKISRAIDQIFNGEISAIINEHFEINMRPTLCTLVPIIENEEITNVILKIRDISELEKLLKDRNELLNNIEKVNEVLRRKSLYSNVSEFDSLIGNSTEMNQIKYLLEKASKIRSTVLISGESGTGKTMLARIIHDLDDKSKPFIHVNCSAIPHDLFESELFGYVNGAFTGALAKGKAGYFELANNGTLFLDEIGEIPNSVQVKLLHAIQAKSFYRIGSQKPVHVNIRIITATNKDLEERVLEGKFREDLYYRINVFPIRMPPLRNRKKDIYPLINSIIARLAADYYTSTKQLSAGAISKLLEYDWPGNIRELENVMERAFNLCETKIIQPEYINLRKSKHTVSTKLKDIVAVIEKKAIIDTIRMCDSNKSQVIEKLGISKSTFYEKVIKYEIKI